MNKVKNSHSRSKTSLISLSEAIGKEVISNTVPFGGVIYDLTKTLIEHGYNLYRDRTEERISEFHESLLRNGNIDENFIKKEFDIDDYYSLLTSSINDLESEKIKIYSQIMHSLISQDIDKNTKIQIIKTSRELTFTEFDFLRKLYINTKYDLMKPYGKESQVEKLLSGTDESTVFIANRLAQHGLINSQNTALTSIAQKIIPMSFSKKKLTPESINEKEFSGRKVLIICTNLNDSIQSKTLRIIQEILTEKKIKSFHHNILARYINPNTNKFDLAILLATPHEHPDIDKQTKRVSDNYLEVSLSSKNIVRINTSKDAEEIIFQNLNITESITLPNNEICDIREYLKIQLQFITT